MVLKTLVLPAPFGPMTAVIWPGAAANDTPRSAWMPPKRRSTPWTSSDRPGAVACTGSPAARAPIAGTARSDASTGTAVAAGVGMRWRNDLAARRHGNAVGRDAEIVHYRI